MDNSTEEYSNWLDKIEIRPNSRGVRSPQTSNELGIRSQVYPHPYESFAKDFKPYLSDEEMRKLLQGLVSNQLFLGKMPVVDRAVRNDYAPNTTNILPGELQQRPFIKQDPPADVSVSSPIINPFVAADPIFVDPEVWMSKLNKLRQLNI